MLIIISGSFLDHNIKRMSVHWKDWFWSWNSSTLATSFEELTHWKWLWGWEGLGAGGEGDDRGWDGWMASLSRWTWVWVNSRSWWWTGRPDVLQFMGSQRVGHDWATDLILLCIPSSFSFQPVFTEFSWTPEPKPFLFYPSSCSLQNHTKSRHYSPNFID